jgi:hypothetical protein|tara:strand:+ start:530 stop:1939 length:1410 start_codon:yes stop_codon:yes gene_type:complete
VLLKHGLNILLQTKTTNKVSFLLTPFNLLFFLLLACSKDSNGSKIDPIDILSIQVDGVKLSSGMSDIDIKPTLTIVFSKGINRDSFQKALKINSSFSSTIESFNYQNNTTLVEVVFSLDYDGTYQLKIQGNIGELGENISNPIDLSFTTQRDEIITSKSPCLTIVNCGQSQLISNDQGEGNFDFYANYPIFEEKARWENLDKAIIVIHGASFNPDDYFRYMTTTLEYLDYSENTVLVAPHFKKIPMTLKDLYWEGYDYRDGKPSGSNFPISSFEVLDFLVSQLADKNIFPALKKIIITGQSSGGRFLHTYAAANRSETAYVDIQFEYIVSESQYFYYPTTERIQEQTNELFEPSTCSELSVWPFGFEGVPDYVNILTKEEFDQRFVNRSITYLLGDGEGSDSSLNTRDCNAVLSGSSRYIRGENMFQYMNLKFSTHNHKKVIVEGVSHQGSAIYTSNEFRSYLIQLSEN